MFRNLKPITATAILTLTMIVISMTITFLSLLILGIENFLHGMIISFVVPLLASPGLSYYFFRLVHELENTKKQLEYLSRTDSLTKIYNRHHLLEKSMETMDTARKHKTNVSLLLLDLDKFKNVNDTYGHLAGDHTLAAFAQIAKKVIRKQDLFGRFGGEEFLILLPDSDLEQAITIADRIRQQISSTPIVVEEGNIQVTVSIGVVSTTAGKHTIDELIYFADMALYQAKNLGRNRYQVAELPACGPVRLSQG